MYRELKKIGTLVAAFVLLVFLVFLVNQVLAFYHNLYAVHPALGLTGAALLVLLLLFLLLAPVWLYFRLPPPLIFPDEAEEWGPYHEQLKSRLARHPLVRTEKLDPYKEEDYEKIHNLLKTRTQAIIDETATAVFLSTAISQNGKLDALTVLAAQVRLVWKVAHVYWQRPSLRNLGQLYANVAFNTLAATGIEKLDLSRQIEPILSALLKSPERHIPLVGPAAHIITDSLLEGSINAFLTLRVGVLTRNYCFPDRGVMHDIRNNSFVEASGMLTALVLKSSGKVVESLLKAGKNLSLRALKKGYGKVGDVFRGARSGLGSLFNPPPAGSEPPPPEGDQTV